MKPLSLDNLLQLHALIMITTGGSAELRDLNRLEAALATQTQNVFDIERYIEPLEKAAALIRGIIGDHPFVDGNKRTAMLAGLTFLQINGVVLTFVKGELEDFAVQVVAEKLDIYAIAGWLEKHK